MTRIRYGARSLDELRNREVEATKVDTWATTLVAIYETDPDAIAAVLPPPLSPPSEPLVRVTVATVDVGRGYPIFGAGTFSVHARHDDVDGDYALVMPMTTEQAVIGGRETFGEPKKLAEISLARDGDNVRGSFTRMGTTFVEITGHVTGEQPPTPDRTRTSFYLKFLPVTDRQGLRRRAVAGLLPPRREDPHPVGRRRRADPARVALRPGRRSPGPQAAQHRARRAVQHPDRRGRSPPCPPTG